MKESSQDVRARKAQLRREQKTRKSRDQWKKKRKNMIAFTYQKDCGCCTGTAYFTSKERAAKVFGSLGLVNGGTFTDDAGEVHDEVDTFYGLSEDAKEFDRPPLQRLAEKVGLIGKEP